MAETPSHKRAKAQAAGPNGRMEVPLSRGRRLDALHPSGRATEIERSGTPEGLAKAARRLRDANASERILQVPEPHMALAAEAMKQIGVKGTVKNMGSTKRKRV